MTPEKESRLKELHVEAMSKIKASFEKPIHFLKFLYECNSFLLLQSYNRSTKEMASSQDYEEIYNCLWFSNELSNCIGVPWSNDRLETEDQQHQALRHFLQTMEHKPEAYSKRLTGLLSAFLTNEFDNQKSYSLYARGFAALYDVNVILNTIENEKLLEIPELTVEQIRQTIREIKNRNNSGLRGQTPGGC